MQCIRWGNPSCIATLDGHQWTCAEDDIASLMQMAHDQDYPHGYTPEMLYPEYAAAQSMAQRWSGSVDGEAPATPPVRATEYNRVFQA